MIPAFLRNRLAIRSAAPKGELDRTKVLFIVDGALINSAMALTSGIFLSGYLVLLGGSDFLVGLLNNSVTWAPIAALFSFILFERMAKRKRLLLTILVISRLLVCLTIFLPLIFGKGPTVLYLLTAMVVAGNMLWGIYGVGHTVWLINTIPREHLSEFFFRRMFWLRITITIITIVMGFLLDWSGKSYTGFLIVFLTSLVISAANVAVLLRTPEAAYPLPVRDAARFQLSALLEPLADRNFRYYLLFIFLFYASQTISSSFTSLYLIRYLKLDYSFISVISIISYFFLIVCIRMWRSLESKIGLKTAYRLSGLLIAMEFIIYGFLTSRTYFLLFFAPILSGIGSSGFNIFTFTRRCDLMPDSNRTVYEGWFGAIHGVSVLIGPVLGNLIMNTLPVIQNNVFQHSRFQLTYMISFVLMAGSLTLAMRSRNRVRNRGDKSKADQS